MDISYHVKKDTIVGAAQTKLGLSYFIRRVLDETRCYSWNGWEFSSHSTLYTVDVVILKTQVCF